MGALVEITKIHSPAGSPQPPTIRAPEIEAGVGCDFDSYLLKPDNTLDDPTRQWARVALERMLSLC